VSFFFDVFRVRGEFRIVFLGDGGIGAKSAFIIRFVHNHFSEGVFILFFFFFSFFVSSMVREQFFFFLMLTSCE